VSGGETLGWSGRAAGRAGDAGETALGQLLGFEFERLHALAQALHVRVGIAPEPPPQRPQRFHDLGPDRADRSIGQCKPIAAEPAAPRDAEPQREQHQVDVELISILQRDQRLGDPGKGVESK
jgi:hypothetical protein